MTEFISRKHGQKGYEIIIKTDSEEKYKAAENFARKLIDHEKPEEAVEHANWTNVTYFEEGRCYGRCSNCMTALRAQNITALREQYRYCRWCGAKMMPMLSKEE